MQVQLRKISAQAGMVLVLAALCAALSAPLAHADISAPTTVNLDTFETPNDGAAGSVGTSDVLTAGRFYGIVVSGTYSAFNQKVWNRKSSSFGLCGTSETDAIFPSPGRAATPVSQDAEVVFGRPWFLPCPQALPSRYDGFQVNLGSGFSHPGANDMPTAAPHANHTYVYLVQGQGQAAQFEQKDTQTGDNYGVLSITVRPAIASDCAGNSACLGNAATAASTAAPSIVAPTSRSCVSRRLFAIHVVTHRRDPVTTATILLNGKRLKVHRTRTGKLTRLSAVVDLRKLPRKKLVVTITARTRSGKVLAGRRTYLTCTTKRKGSKPPL